MILTINTWDGHNINDVTNFRAWFPRGTLWTQVGAQRVLVSRSENAPLLGAKVWNEKVLPVRIEMRGVIGTQIDTLLGWFDVNDKTLKVLDCTDGSSKHWYIYASVDSVVNVASAEEDGASSMTVLLAVQDPIWRSVTLNSDTWNITATGQQKTITPAGNRVALPIYTITPTAQASGNFTYHRFIVIKNQTAKAFDNYPVDVTGGGLDTATLVGAGKMLASGDDLGVVIDGQVVDRWLGGMNGVSTKVWANLSLLPKQTSTLGTAIAGSGAISEIQFKAGTANDKALRALPDSGILMIDSEIFTYSGKNVKLRKVGNVSRAAKGTSMGTHTTGAAVTWIEHDVWMLYGYATAATPEVDDTKKPAFELTSTNTSWVYSSAFADIAGQRSGAWLSAVLNSDGGLSTIYTAASVGDADPATAMGMQMLPFYTGARITAESASLVWELYSPAGFTTVTSNGNKKRVGTSWPTYAGLWQSLTGSKWSMKWNETSPVGAGAFGAWTHNAQALTGNPEHIRFLFWGSVGAVATNEVDFEVTGATIALYASGVPSVTLNAEAANTQLAARITNTTSGEFMDLLVPMVVNTALTVDTDARTITYGGTPLMSALVVESVRGRPNWLALAAGVGNVLQFDQVGTGNVTIVTQWRDRSA